MKKLSLIGLGVLGLQTADLFASNGYSIYGTSRQSEKQHALAKKGYQVSLFDVYNHKQLELLDAAMFQDAKVIINIAPGRRYIDVQSYVDAMKALIDKAIVSGASHLIFVSTTSVFGEQSGVLNELSPPSPSSNSGKAHLQIEQYLLARYSSVACVLRLAGLVGKKPDGELRHPIFSLAKRSLVKGGNEPVNLVHQDDVVSMLEAIIHKRLTGQILHACAEEHPSRQDYYQWAAKSCHLPVPSFEHEQASSESELAKKRQAHMRARQFADA